MKKNLIFTALVLALICAICTPMLIACNPSEDENGDNTETETPALAPHSQGAVYSYGNYTATHEKAILFLPGLMASAMYSTENSKTNTWGIPFFFSAVGDLLGAAKDKNLTTEQKQTKLDNLLKTIACDENSLPYTKQRIANMQDEYCYDAFEGMSYSYELLKPYYEDSYDMLVWQYDWRQSVSGAAEELEIFINLYGYKQVCFVTHSLGGAVVAQYLARSEDNRTKTQLFVPFAAPFFGSFDAVTYLFDIQREEGYKAPSLEDYDINEVLTDLLGGSDPDANPIDLGTALINNMMGSELALTDITRNLASIYQMLPSATALMNTPFFDPNSPNYVGMNSPYLLNGSYVTTDETFIDFLNNLSWTHRQDGQLKPAVASIPSYYDSLFFDDGKGGKVFVTELVTTEYIVGINCNTTIGIVLDEKGQIVDTIDTDLGDYTIPAYSASAGLPLDHERVHTVDKSHNYIANDTADHPLEETGLQFLVDIFARNIG